MKKLLFTLALMLVTLAANAQCNCNHEPVRYWYIYALVGIKKEIKYYDGSEERAPVPFLDDNGNKIYVRNGIGLLNYFTLQGWEYIKEEGGLFFLRKTVTEEEAKEKLSKVMGKQN